MLLYMAYQPMADAALGWDMKPGGLALATAHARLPARRQALPAWPVLKWRCACPGRRWCPFPHPLVVSVSSSVGFAARRRALQCAPQAQALPHKLDLSGYGWQEYEKA
jgi:hypothetical protein